MWYSTIAALLGVILHSQFITGGNAFFANLRKADEENYKAEIAYQKADRYPESVLIANINENREYKDATDIQIKGFQVLEGKGLKQTDISIEETSLFRIVNPGIYITTTTIIFKSHVSGIVSMTMSSVKENGSTILATKAFVRKGESTLQLYGTVKFFFHDLFMIKLSSLKALGFTVKVKSTVSLIRMGLSSEMPAFMGNLANDMLLEADKYIGLLPISLSKSSHSFSETEFFSSNTGQFSAPISGMYYIAANIIIKKERKFCQYTVVCSLNINNKVSETIYQPEKSSIYYPINLAFSLYLKRGEILSIGVRSHYPVKSEMLKTSTFSVCLLNSMFTDPVGFSLEAQNSKMVINQGWTSVSMDKLSASMKGGKSSGSAFSLSQNRFSVNTEAVYLYSSVIKVSSLSPLSGIIVSLLINGIPIDYTDGSFLSSSVNTASLEISLSFSTLLYLGKGDYVTVNVYNSLDNPWYIEKGSIFSVCMLKSFSAVFNLGLVFSPKMSVGWIEVNGWKNQNTMTEFDFSLSYNKVDGRFHVLRTGIYFVHVKLVLVSLDVTFIQMVVAVDGQPNKADGLSARKTNAVGSTTLIVSSVIRLVRGSYLSVFVYLEGIKNIEINDISQFSLMYLCHEDLAVGFHSILPSDIVIDKNNKWIPIDSFQTHSNGRPWIFNQLFNSPSENIDIIINQGGFYIIFANIIIGHTDLLSSNSFYQIMLQVNEEGNHQVVMAKQSSQYSSGLQNRNNEITLSIQSTVKLKQKDKISIKVYSNLDDYFVIRKASGLAAILIYDIDSPFANGFLVPKTKSEKVETDYISGWSTIGTGGGRFDTGNMAVIYGGEQLKVMSGGIYIISFCSEFVGSSTREVTIGVAIKESGNAEQRYSCAMSAMSSATSTLCCPLMIYLKANTDLRLTAQTKGTDGDVGIGEHGYFSAIKVLPIGGFPYLWALLRKQTGIHGQSKSLKGWISEGRSELVAYSKKTFSDSTGLLTISATGKYFVSVCLQFDMPLLSSELIAVTIGSIKDSFNATIGKRARYETLSFTTIVDAERGSTIGIKVSSSFPLSLGTKTRMSVSLIPKHFYPYLYTLKTTKNIPLTSSKRTTINGWAPLIMKSSAIQDRFLLNGESLYLLLLNLRGEIKGNNMGVYIQYSNQKRSLLYLSKSKTFEMFTLTLANVLLTADPISAELELDSLYGLNGVISTQSRLHLLKIGDHASTVCILIRTSQLVTYNGVQDGWIRVRGMYIEHINSMYYMDSKVLVKISGLYILTLNVIFDVAKRVGFELGIYGFREGSIVPGLFSSKEMEYGGTLSITATIYLERGMTLQPYVKTDYAIQFSIEQDSSFSLVLLENLEAGIAKDFGPVVLSELVPNSYLQLEIGKQQNLHCNAVGDGAIQYYWYRDNVLLQFRTKELILKGHSLEAGTYYCEAKIGERKTLSKPTRVKIYDVDECTAGLHNCTRGNQTCVNTQGSYYCACANGFAFRGGECLVMSGEPGFQMKYRKNYLPTAVRVLVPILCIVIFFIFALSIYTCYKHQKSRGNDLNAETVAFTDGTRDRNGDLDENPAYNSGLYEMGETPIEDDEDFADRNRREALP